ncbi:hypothetical protein CBR_g700 [Chara braunii]|uniref:Uncharacterized protein n=1 Tax=Chara braunii TaxID=69332 RepID=A0A388KC15_CHABU|nr:hypothetical protein CBR_g700 [Chara braunii]|eukprot:GBG67571.1 hypothetical protein CBR_g700 [Chara braunii]
MGGFQFLPLSLHLHHTPGGYAGFVHGVQTGGVLPNHSEGDARILGVQRRDLPQDPSGIRAVNITFLAGSFDYVGEVVPESTPSKRMLKEYIDISPDNSTLFYVEMEAGNWTSFVVMRAIPSGSTSPLEAAGNWNLSWTISQVAGPFTNVSGLLVLDESCLLLSFHSENLIRKVNATSGEEMGSIPVREPYSIAKHPSEETVFVASNDSIIALSLILPEKQQTLVGPTIAVTKIENGSSTDNSTAAEFRFLHPSIGPHSLSPNGSHLYVADEDNHVIRRVNTVTGATETIAGQEGNASTSNGYPRNARFSFPRCPAMMYDGLNLLLVERAPGIRWLIFGQQNGAVNYVSTMLESNQSIGCVTFSKDDRFMFFPADTHIFVLVNFTMFPHGVASPAPPALTSSMPPLPRSERTPSGEQDPGAKPNGGTTSESQSFRHLTLVVVLALVFATVLLIALIVLVGIMHRRSADVDTIRPTSPPDRQYHQGATSTRLQQAGRPQYHHGATSTRLQQGGPPPAQHVQRHPREVCNVRLRTIPTACEARPEEDPAFPPDPQSLQGATWTTRTRPQQTWHPPVQHDWRHPPADGNARLHTIPTACRTRPQFQGEPSENRMLMNEVCDRPDDTLKDLDGPLTSDRWEADDPDPICAPARRDGRYPNVMANTRDVVENQSNDEEDEVS